MELPEVTDVQRLHLEPGDALLLRVDREVISEEHAQIVRERVRAILRLPPDFPVLVVGSDWDVKVVSHS